MKRFEIHTTYDYRTSKAYVTMHYTTQVKTLTFLRISGIIGILFPLAVRLCTPLLPEGLLPVFLPGLLFWTGCFLLAFAFISPRLSARTMNGKHGKTPASNIVNLYDDHITCIQDKREVSLKYNQVVQIFEDAGFFYLYIDRDAAYILDKSGFTMGTPDELRKFLHEKTRHPIVFRGRKPKS